jgi:predicted dehydrogenase
MKPLRLAIPSATGTAQKRTIPALVNSKLVTVSAIQGRNPEKLRDVSDKYGIQYVFTDEHKLLDEDSYDAVMICSPPYMHFSQAKRVIDRGTHCLIEKPAAMSAEECNELSHLAVRRAVVVHVATTSAIRTLMRECRKFSTLANLVKSSPPMLNGASK